MISAGELDGWQSRNGPPDDEAGVALAWSGILGRGPDLAVALTGAAAFSTGVRLDVAVRARTSHDRQLFDAVLGNTAASDRLLLGVELADGRVATSGWPPSDLAADAASLVQGAPVPPPPAPAARTGRGPVRLAGPRPRRDADRVHRRRRGRGRRGAAVAAPAARHPRPGAGGWFARVLGRDT